MDPLTLMDPIPIITSTKRIKYLNLSREIKVKYAENYKTLMKKSKMTLGKPTKCLEES